MSKFFKILLSILIFGLIFIFPAVSQEDESEERREMVQAQATMQQAARQALRQVLEWSREGLAKMYVDFLTQEGYRPEIDRDGDIQFKVMGSNYFIIIDETDLQFFHIYTGFSLDNLTIDEAYNLINYANRRSKVAKLSVSSPSSNKIVVSITAELLIENPADFSTVFFRALSLIDNAKSIFQTQVTQVTQRAAIN
ncbi:MAG: hypothetical protein FWB86_02910 [Treponema sp.]|nr:hypothetical protein [Treponema sp.]MCL2251718.1 hypothetical protein [Treponema sp.]